MICEFFTLPIRPSQPRSWRVSTLGLVAVILAAQPLLACTTAVISGRATPDGRPLLWKNRDISTTANEVVRIEGGRYDLVAVVNSGARKSIWMGVNSAGLCIENSVVRDLSVAGANGPGNGSFMLLVLQNCGSLEDVKKLLQETDVTGRSTAACYGIIDAHGGAAIFETSARSHVMFDANDPKVAPRGYVVRSNFSFTGQGCEQAPTPQELAEVYSAGRYFRAKSLLDLVPDQQVDARFMIRHVARDLSDKQGLPYPGSVNGETGTLPALIPTADTISRTTTVSFAVFQGVAPGETPDLTTMWVGLGDPKFSAAVPCWVAAGTIPEELRGDKLSPICGAAIALRKEFYQAEPNGVATEGLPEVWSELWSLENGTFDRVEAKLAEWRQKGKPDRASMQALQISAAEQTLAALKNQLQRVQAPVVTTGE